MTVPYADLADLPEDDRIAIMGRMAEEKLVAFFVDDDPDKADRYIRKLLAGFKVRLVERRPGPIAHSVLVKIGPLEH